MVKMCNKTNCTKVLLNNYSVLNIGMKIFTSQVHFRLRQENHKKLFFFKPFEDNLFKYFFSSKNLFQLFGFLLQ